MICARIEMEGSKKERGKLSLDDPQQKTNWYGLRE